MFGVEIPLANLHFEITRRVFIAEVFNFHSRMLKFLFSTGMSAHCSVLNNFMQIYRFQEFQFCELLSGAISVDTGGVEV